MWGSTGARLLLNSQVWGGTEEKMIQFQPLVRTIENCKPSIHLPHFPFLRVEELLFSLILHVCLLVIQENKNSANLGSSKKTWRSPGKPTPQRCLLVYKGWLGPGDLRQGPSLCSACFLICNMGKIIITIILTSCFAL